MSAFELEPTLDRARLRLPPERSHRRRSDAGQPRLHRRTLARLRTAVLGQERPRFTIVHRDLAAWCRSVGLPAPARASIYGALAHLPGHAYRVPALPAHVQATLYNLDLAGSVPGHQLAFYCFNYGGLAAVSFAAGLPWLDLYQAARLGGWRPRSRGLLTAALAARGIA
jgi:hypothetical protein